MIKFLSDEINEPVIKQYLETCPKNAAYDSSDSFDCIIVSLNSHLKEKFISIIVNAVDSVIFADKATSAARKEMMRLFLSAYDEEEKEVTLEFCSIASVASTKSEVLMDKVQERLLHNNIDISNTRYSCFYGTNTMSRERTGLQRRIRNVAPFPIYVNYRCHCLALSFKHLFDQFPWLEPIDRLLLVFILFWKKRSHFEIYSRSIWSKSAESCKCCSYQMAFPWGQMQALLRKIPYFY